MNQSYDLSAALRRRRQQLGLSLSQVARLIRSSPATVHRYESGWQRFEIYTLRKLASALGCHLRIRLQPIPRPPAPAAPAAAVARLRRLFWDADLAVEDLHSHRAWVARRVLEMGDLGDVQALASVIGRNGLLQCVRALRFASKKAEACWRAMLWMEGIRCTQRSFPRAAGISWLR